MMKIIKNLSKLYMNILIIKIIEKVLLSLNFSNNLNHKNIRKTIKNLMVYTKIRSKQTYK